MFSWRKTFSNKCVVVKNEVGVRFLLIFFKCDILDVNVVI